MTGERLLGGRYQLREVVGYGGMADVHLARDVHLDRWVAVKILRDDLARDPMFRARFRREAQAVAGLNHATIVAVYDIGHGRIDEGRPEGAPFMVMEYVAGPSLRDLLDDGELALADAVRHELGVLSALAVSHKAGVVHRDIKPANVMLTLVGAVKVVDFGIARSSGDRDAGVTETRAVLGTAQYLSPEQVRGELADARSDLYSAGCLLYELLTGRPPFLGDSPVAVAYQHVHEEPDPASTHRDQITPALDDVLRRALEKDREDRFQSAREFTDALQSAAKGLVDENGCLAPDHLTSPAGQGHEDLCHTSCR